MERMERKKRKLKAFLELIKSNGDEETDHLLESKKDQQKDGLENVNKLQKEIKKNLNKKSPRIMISEDYFKSCYPNGTYPVVDFTEIQLLMMSCFTPAHLRSFTTTFCDVQNIDYVTRVNVYLVEEPSLFKLTSDEAILFHHMIRFKPCENWVEKLMLVPLTKTFASKVQKEGAKVQKVEDLDEDPEGPATKTQLLLSLSQMIGEGYPVPGTEFEPSLRSYNPVRDDSPLIALDCEMCLTTADKLEVTKIVLLNEEEEILLESYVKPENRIVDYLTPFSGVTKEILDPITTRLEDVRQQICQLLPPDSILVGQSLENDLKCLGIFHPYVMDTSVLYNLSGCRNIKSSLKNLARRFLDENIQNGSGHCPVEDARSALRLVKLKLSKGFKYGDNVLSEKRFGWSTDSISYLPLSQYLQQKGIKIRIFYDFVDYECPKSLNVFSSNCLKTKETILKAVSKVSGEPKIHLVLTSDGLCYIRCR